MGLPPAAGARGEPPAPPGRAGRNASSPRRGEAGGCCETSQPPAYYFPPDDVRLDLLEGVAPPHLLRVEGPGVVPDGRVGDAVGDRRRAGCTSGPVERFEAIRDHLAFYPQRLDCFVDGERVTGNDGTFYGGWISSFVVGPFKGGSGTATW